MNKSDSSYPIVNIDLQHGQYGCKQNDNCEWYKAQMEEKLVGRYIAHKKPFDGQIVAAFLNVMNLSFADYYKQVKKLYKGNIKKADKLGCICHPFPYELFIPDIVAVNHSKNIRCGRPMTAPYRRSIADFGGAPTKAIPLTAPKCPVHYDYWWGIFLPLLGYMQGDVTTNEKLIAYIRLRRNGNYALYAQILGHGDYLKYGIMYRLHLAIVEWISHNGAGLTNGLEYLIYAGYFSGKEGLQLWKKKTLFKPAYMVLEPTMQKI